MNEDVKEIIEKQFDVYGNLLYHYCSMDVFKSIIEKKELWLCNARHSNDTSELQYIIYVAKQMKENKEISQLQYDKIEKFYKDAQGYIVCMSQNADSLSQWRGYADDASGFSIGFNLSTVDNYALPLPSNGKMYLKKVEYVDEKIKEKIKDLIRNFKGKINDIFEFQYFIYGLDQYSWKNSSFEEENEFRLIYVPVIEKRGNGYEIDPNVLSKIKFKQSRGKISAYFPLAFPEDKINRIIIGPKNNMTEDEVKLFLKASGFDETIIDVEKSKIPYC